MKIGDLVKFSRAHCAQPGLDYCAPWLGTILGVTDESIEIYWFGHPGSGYASPDYDITEYDEQWWNTLDYKPFEVANENR